MRFIKASLVLAISIVGSDPLQAADPKSDAKEVDRQLYDVLREIHNRGADLYDTGDRAGTYRMFQGTLLTARALLAHRPGDQKFIDDGMDAAEKLSTPAMKAYSLHEVIDNLRKRIKPTGSGELLTVPPREQNLEPPMAKEPVKFKPPLDGMGGAVHWKGAPLADVELMFVSRERAEPQIYETKTNSDGLFMVRKMRPGKYTVLLERIRENKLMLPERYRSTQTSPLIIEVAGKGEVIDLILQ